MKSSLLAASFLGAALALTACLSDHEPDISPVDQADKYMTSPYLESDGFIITPRRADTVVFCDEDIAHSEIDSTGPDSTSFTISGNALSLHGKPDTLESGAVVLNGVIYTRIGSGKGLEGFWRYSVQDYRVVSGTLSANEQKDRDLQVVYAKRYTDYMQATLQFAGGRLTTYLDGNTAARFADNWKIGAPESEIPADSSLFDMDLLIVDKYTVELKGRKTGETVRIRLSPRGDMTYTSDRIGHEEHTFHAFGKTCPNPFQPAWYTQFRAANSKIMEPLPKSGLNPEKKPKSRPIGP